jgi:hypothetical protein
LAIEGFAGIGGHVATRLPGDRERVVEVPPKLSARAWVFATGQGGKTDTTDVHLLVEQDRHSVARQPPGRRVSSSEPGAVGIAGQRTVVPGELSFLIEDLHRPLHGDRLEAAEAGLDRVVEDADE